MKHLNNWKVYEGVYGDYIKKIESLELEKEKIKSDYLSEVRDCIWDLIDDWGAENSSLGAHFDDTTDTISTYWDISVSMDITLIGKLLDLMIDVNEVCKSHLGREIEFTSLIAYNKTSFTTLSTIIGNVNDRATSDFVDKGESLRYGMERFISQSPSFKYGNWTDFKLTIKI
jgi:hypothetical protein